MADGGRDGNLEMDIVLKRLFYRLVSFKRLYNGVANYY